MDGRGRRKSTSLSPRVAKIHEDIISTMKRNLHLGGEEAVFATAAEMNLARGYVREVWKGKALNIQPVSGDSFSALIEKTLLKRYPDRKISHGDQSALADEIGCSRELVRQRANRLGFKRSYKREETEKRLRTCPVCGGEKETRKLYCFDCSHPEVTCVNCGETFRRQRNLVTRKKGGNKTGFYCSRECLHEASDSWTRKPRRPANVSPLGKLRAELGLRQKDLAEILGVTTATVTAWEDPNRGRDVSPENAEVLEKWLNSVGKTLEDVDLKVATWRRRGSLSYAQLMSSESFTTETPESSEETEEPKTETSWSQSRTSVTG